MSCTLGVWIPKRTMGVILVLKNFFKEPECAGNGIVGIAKNGVPIYNSVGGDCCDLALKVSICSQKIF